MAGITKKFGPVIALDSVNLNVRAQTLHAVVGENGAGKTTLMQILYGSLHPDRGDIELHGKPIAFSDTQAAIKAGIGMVSQHYAIIPELTALENLILGAEGRLILERKRAKLVAQELAQKLRFSFEWDQPAADLSPAGAQKLEILKLLWRKAQVMILDEPTAMLSPADSDSLFQSLHELAEGGATVIIVTHRLPEVMEHCQGVTVLRGGKLIDEQLVANTDASELSKMIVGADLPGRSPRHAPLLGDSRLRIKDLTIRGKRGEDAVKQISIEVKAGEILGIAGVDGSGQRELFQAIAGVQKQTQGTLEPGGTTAQRIEDGLRLIPEDRHAEGIIENWSLEENSALGLQHFSPLDQGGSINVAARRSWAQSVAERFNTRFRSISQPMSTLSGGNQQRFVAARAMGFGPKLLLAFQPARGLDIGATIDVYAGIRQTCEQGAAAIVVSFDLDELLEHCDRIVVMNGGHLFEPQSKNRDEIGRLMVGSG